MIDTCLEYTATKQVEANQQKIANLRKYIVKLEGELRDVKEENSRFKNTIENLKIMADETPVGAEDRAKGSSIYNWLICYRKFMKELEATRREDEKLLPNRH